MSRLLLITMSFLCASVLWAQDSGGSISADSTKMGSEPAKAGQPEAASDSVQMETASPQYVLGLGVSVGVYGGGISTANAEGRKVNPAFWPLPNYSAVIFAPFVAGSSLGCRLDIGVSSTGTKTRPYEFYSGKKNWEGYFTEKYTYFTIAPQLSFAGVLIGVGFNFPMTAERWNSDIYDTHYYVDKNIMNSPKIDLRLGGMISVWETKAGKLLVELQAKYDLTGTYEDNMYVYGHPVDSRGVRPSNYLTETPINLTTASFSIGFGYLFNLGL